MSEARPVAPDAPPERRAWGPVLLLLASNAAGAVAGGVFFYVATRGLDLDEMGRYAVAISAQWIAVGLVGSGLSVATVRLAAHALARADERAAAGLVLTSVAVAVGVGLLGVIVCLALDRLGLGPFGLAGRVLALVIAWATARSIIDVLRAGLLAGRRYGRAGWLMLSSAATGLVALAGMFATGPLTLTRLLMAHAVGLGACALLGPALLTPVWRSGMRVSGSALRALLDYARWPSASEAARLFQINLGPILLTALVGADEAGRFGVGRYPAYLFEIMAVSLYQFWLPEAVRRGAVARLHGFLEQELRLAATLGGAMALAAWIALPVLPMLGPKFAAASTLFLLSTIDFAIVLCARPIESVFHGLGMPRLELGARLLGIVAVVSTAVVLAPRYGAEGMIWAHILAGLIALAASALLARRWLDLGSSRSACDTASARRRCMP